MSVARVIERLTDEGLCTTAKDCGSYVQTDKGNVFVKLGTGKCINLDIKIIVYSQRISLL